jgi:hypothetical protein
VNRNTDTAFKECWECLCVHPIEDFLKMINGYVCSMRMCRACRNRREVERLSPERREKMMEQQRKRRDHIRANDPERLEQIREYHRKAKAKKYTEIKKDPAKYNEFRERRNEANRRYRERQKAKKTPPSSGIDDNPGGGLASD